MINLRFKGFSLVELLVVILVFAILSTISVGSFSSVISDLNVISLQNQIYFFLNNCKKIAKFSGYYIKLIYINNKIYVASTLPDNLDKSNIPINTNTLAIFENFYLDSSFLTSNSIQLLINLVCDGNSWFNTKTKLKIKFLKLQIILPNGKIQNVELNI